MTADNTSTASMRRPAAFTNNSRSYGKHCMRLPKQKPLQRCCNGSRKIELSYLFVVGVGWQGQGPMQSPGWLRICASTAGQPTSKVWQLFAFPGGQWQMVHLSSA